MQKKIQWEEDIRQSIHTLKYLQFWLLSTLPECISWNFTHCNSRIYMTYFTAYFYMHNNNRGCSPCSGWNAISLPSGNESCQTEESPRCYLLLVVRWAYPSTLSHILWVTRLTTWPAEGKDPHYTALQQCLCFYCQGNEKMSLDENIPFWKTAKNTLLYSTTNIKTISLIKSLMKIFCLAKNEKNSSQV